VVTHRLYLLHYCLRAPLRGRRAKEPNWAWSDT